MRAAAEGRLKGILGYSDEPLVSGDFLNSKLSSVVDAPSTFALGGNMVKVLSWYDNKIRYSQRMVDLAKFIGERLV